MLLRVHALRAATAFALAFASTTWISIDTRAQEPLDSGPDTIAWPAAAVGGVPTRGVTGDFTGDCVTDAVFLTAGGGATLVYGPGVHSSFVHLPSDVRDAAAWRGAPGDADRLLVVDGTGLRVLSDYDAGSFTATTLLAGAPWSSAIRILLGHANSDALVDAVGLAADGRTILFAGDIGGSSPSVSSFTMSYDVHDLALVAWSPQPAIVVLTTAGVHVRRAGGSVVVEYLGGTFASGMLASFQQSGLGHERVAAVYDVPGSGGYLGVLDKNGPVQVSSLGSIGAYALAAGDVDEDGLDDLVILQRTNHDALLLVNQGGSGAPFGASEWVELGLGSQSASGQTAAPVLADLTNDRDLDLLVHVAANDTLVTIENTSTAHANAAPVVESGFYAYSFLAQAGVLNLEVEPSFTVHPFTPTGVEIVVWTQDVNGTAATALYHGYFALDGAGLAHPSFPIEEADVATSKIYHVAMQTVRVVSGVTLEAGPTGVWSFATPTEDVEALEIASGAEGVRLRIFLEDEDEFMTALDEEERVLTPSTVPTPKVPPIPEPPDPFGD